MTPWELDLAGVLYVSVAIRYGLNDNPGMCLSFAAYAVANVGFLWASK